MDEDERKLTVSVADETASSKELYRVTILRPGGGIELPGSFSNRARAERVARFLEKELQPEFEREDADMQRLVNGLR